MKTLTPLSNAKVDRKASFRVIAVVRKPDALGMLTHIVTTRDGVAFSVSRGDELAPNTDFDVSVRSEHDAGGHVSRVELDWEGAGFEFPVRVAAPPKAALDELFSHPTAAQ